VRRVSGTAGAGRRAATLLLAALAGYLLVIAWLLRPPGGLLGRYMIRVEGNGEIPVYERLDPQIDFPVPQRLDAAYIFHWDLRRLGFPASMPPASIHWRGLLRVPRSGEYGFSVESQGATALRIDGASLEIEPDALTECTLTAGLHPIELDYAVAEGEAKVVLRWRPPGERARPIPSAALAPDRSAIDRAGRRRLAGEGLLVAGLAAAIVAGVAARRGNGAAARLAARIAAERGRLALGAILILAAVLRLHDYTLVPFHHETADEYQHAWEGWNLLHHGIPQAWSTFPDRYPPARIQDLRWFGDRYVLVQPYFDHPPLFSILVGAVATAVDVFGHLAAVTPLPGPFDAFACSLPVMRLVPIALSLVGLVMLCGLARAYGVPERAALLGALVYAVLPVIVLSHRLVKGESLLALLLMGAILAARRHEATGAPRDAAVAGLLCGLSLWTKATGVAVVAVVLVMLLSARRARGALLASGIALGFLGLYVLYAWAFDLGIFLNVLQAQATSKWVSLDALQDLLSGKVVTKLFGRGTYLWLLLAAGVMAFRRQRALLLPVAIYATIIALTADQRVIYGWYRIPLYPFLCLAAGLYLEEMIEASDLFLSFPFAATAVSAGLLYVLPPAQSKGAMSLFALLAVGPYLLRLAREGPRTTRLARAATYLLLLLLVVTSVGTIGNVLEIYASTRGVR